MAAENACVALRILDGALGGLLEATQASAQGAGVGSPAVREAHRDFTVPTLLGDAYLPLTRPQFEWFVRLPRESPAATSWRPELSVLNLSRNTTGAPPCSEKARRA